jgi:hypothetical protein
MRAQELSYKCFANSVRFFKPRFTSGPLYFVGQSIGRRLRDSLRSSAFCKDEALNLNVRASIGLATYPHDAKTPHDIIRQADEMMYMVKNSTRDNIGIAQRGVVK